MSRSHTVVRGALSLGVAAVAAAAAAACNGDTHIVMPTVNNSIFQSYVALGNSITAGYQSGGINDSTQRLSYAVLLAKQMGTRFAYPSLVMPGCPPPVSNLLTQARVTLSKATPSTSTTCALRDTGSVRAIINNVAVPGIASADPDAAVGPNANTLVQLFLGGETMVQKALDAQPTFATVWVGNNDILVPALSGLPSTATTVPTFITNYAKDINALVAGAPNLKGVLIGVVQVAAAPIMFRAGLLAQSPAAAAAASQVAGRPVSLDPVTCAGTGATALVNFQYIAAIQARPAGFPGTVYCGKVLGGGASDPGDNGILDPAEQLSVANTINGYNAYIKAKADSIGFAYYDPNPTLAGVIAAGLVPPFPNLASAQPFGQYFSLDGVHPTGASHILIANALIDVINAKYQTTLTKIPTT
jgi:lysophospholipase L1-like esterase